VTSAGPSPVLRLWPDAGPVPDVAALVAAEARPAPPDRPWVVVTMVTSLDGATAVDGVSGPLGGAADQAVFSALRAVADVVVAGAGTVRAEGYGPPRTPAARRSERLARGQTEAPRIAVVTRSLDLDWSAPLFTDAHPGAGPLVLTCTDADATGRARAGEVAEVIAAGAAEVDLAAALRELRARGSTVVLAEGGPRLNGALLAADLVDEWCLTVAPALVGGGSSRAVVGPEQVRHLRLDRVLEGDGALLLRYLRRG
jgi:riboflavin biosynthesis pyrimidine reductase